MLNSQGAPVAGASLSVQAIYSSPVDDLARFLKGGQEWTPRCWKGPLPGSPPTIVTDAEGRWRCAGFGRDRIAAFALEGPGVPRTALNVTTRPGEEASKSLHILGPAYDYLTPAVHTIRGVVRDRSTTNPIAGIQVSIRPGNATTRTGPDGQFEVLDAFETAVTK